jgi:hypothetical protein
MDLVAVDHSKTVFAHNKFGKAMTAGKSGKNTE